VIDDYPRFVLCSSETERARLSTCLTSGSEVGVSIILTGGLVGMRFYDDVLKQVKSYGCGILLGGTEGIDEFNNTPRPSGHRGFGFPLGRGYLIQSGIPRLFQAGICWQEHEKAISETAFQKCITQLAARAQDKIEEDLANGVKKNKSKSTSKSSHNK